MKKYSAYKDSGIDQFGEIPVHWSIIPLKYSFVEGKDSIKTGPFGSQLKSTDFVNEGFKVYNQRTVYDENFHQNELYIDDEKFNQLKGFEVFSEEILITSRGTIGRCTIVLKGIERGVLHPCLIRIRLNQKLLTNIYLWYYINQSPLFIETVKLESNATTIEVIYSDTLKNLLFPLPPLPEQQAIVTYLDEKTTLIDDLIKKKQEKIQLLKENRTALINHVVTKGLDPEVEMKDSGVEWIGEIPEHWKLVKVGHYTEIVRGASPRPAGDPSLFDGDFINWITVKEVTSKDGKFVISTDTMLTEEGMKQSRVLEPETLVLTNSGVTLGVPGILKIRGCINDGSVAFIKISDSLVRDFLYYFFTTQTKLLLEQQSGYGQPNLNTEIVSNIRFPLPPISEQQQIVTYLDEQTQLMDQTIQQEEQKIELLKEYRQSLISEVVTGKICVLGN